MPFKGDPSKLDSAFQSVITPTGQENQGNAFDSFLKNEDPKTATKSQFGRGFEAGWDQIAGGLQYLTGDIAEEVPAWKEWGEAVKEGGARQLANAPKGQGMFYDMGTFVPQGLGIVGALLSAPVTAGTSLEVITPILGYSNLAALTGSVAGSAGYDYDTYTEENNLPRNEYVKAGVMLGSALMEIVGEYGLIPLNKGMSRYSGRLFKNLYKEGVAGKYAAQELIRDADSAYNLAVNFQKASPEGFKKLMQYATQMGKNAVGEGSEEFITQVGQDLLQNLYLEGDDKFNFQELMNDSMHAFRGGAMMGVMVSPFSTWTNNKLAQQRRQNQGGAFFGTSKDNETFEVVNVKPNGNTTILLPTGQEKTIPNEDITEKVFITNDDIDIIKGKIDKGQQIVKEEGRKMEENGLRQELNNQVSMFLNKDTQTLMSATKKDGTRIFITKGNPTAKSRVNDIAVLDPKTGKKEVLASNELDLNDLEERDPEEFVNNEVQRHFYEKDVQEQELIRNTQNSIKAQPGRSVVLPDGKTGTIQSIAPDGKLVITSEGEKGMPVVNTLPIDAVQVIEESDIDQIKQQMQQENGTNIQPKEQQQTAPVQTLPIGGKEYAYSEQEDGSVILDIGKAKPEQALKDVQSNLQDGYQAELLTEQQQPDQNVPAFIKQEPKKVVKGIRITQVQQTEQTTQQPVSQAQTTFNGNPVSDKEAMAIIEASDTIDDLQGLNTESEQIKKQIAKKYPESLPKYTINGKEVDREFAQNFLKYVKSSEKLNSIKVSNDEEFSQMLKNKASELGVTYNDSKQENKSENKKDKVVPKNKQLSLRKGRRAGQGSITKYSDLVDEDPVSIRHAILQYFLSGGRVNTDSVKDAVKFNMEERRQRIWMMANNAPTFDRLEEIILQELPQYEDARAGLNEFRDELNDVILSLPTMASMVDEINKMKQQIEQPPVPEEFKDFTPEDFQDQADNNPEDYSEAHKFLEDNWPVFEEFFNNGVLDWNALENKLNTDETFFTVFPFGLYDNEIVTLRKIISDEQSRNEIEQRLQQGESRSDNQTAVQGQETPTDRGNEGNGEPEQIQQQSEVTPELKKETSVNQEDNGTENTAIEAQSNNDQISPELQSRIDEKKKQIEDLKKKHEQMRDKLLSRNGLWGDTQDDGSPKMFDDNFEPTSENIDKALAPIKGEIAAAKRELQNLESGVKEAAGQEEINLDDQISNTAKNNELKKAEKEINLNPSEEQKAKENSASKNKIVTDERYEELKRRMKGKLGNLNVGFDPEIFTIGAEMAAYHVEKGARKFAAFAKAMIADLGNAIKPYLKPIYNAARDFPGMEGYAKEMDSYDEVSKIDVNKIDKEPEAPKERPLPKGALGRNANGNPIFEDDKGVRSYTEGPIKVTAPVGIIPGTNTISVEGPETLFFNGRHQFLTTDEIAKFSQNKDNVNRINKTIPKQQTNNDIYLEDISEKAFSVKGDTRPIKDEIKSLGGRWNKAHGWIFPKTKKEEVSKALNLVPNSISEVDLFINDIKDLLAERTKITNTPTLVRYAEQAGMKAGIHYNNVKELYDIAGLALNQYILDNANRFKLTGKNSIQIRQILSDLDQLSNLLPTETQRSETQVDLQQFSTPLSLAALVNWTAQIKDTDTVLEPSAGEGNIAVFAKAQGAKVIANEIDKTRKSLLEKLGVDKVTGEDAKILHAVNAIKEDKVTVVIMNPPFSRDVALGGKMDIHAAEKHIDAALNKLEEEGRLVAVVGRGMSLDSLTHKPWWNKIKKDYHVRANILISGEAYRKKGTNFDNRILVIDKNGETFQSDEIIGGQVDNYTELISKLEQIPNKPRIIIKEGSDGRNNSNIETESNRLRTGTNNTLPTGNNDTRSGELQFTDARPTEDGRPYNGLSKNERQGNNDVDGTGTRGTQRGTQGNKGRTDNRRQTSDGGAIRSNVNTSGQLSGQSKNKPGRTQQGQRISVKQEPNKKATGENIGYETYVPELIVNGSKKHPTTLVESTAMASVNLPTINYQPILPEKTITTGALSDAQLEDVILAGQAHEATLPSGDRRGYFLGAGTGYGKGRTIAAVILDNFNHGRDKAVWLSKNTNAHEASAEYWEAVGGDPTDIFWHKSAKTPINKDSGVLLTTYDTMKSKFDPRKDYNDDFWSEKHETRLQQLVQWLGKDFDGVIVFDEAHQMANAKDTKVKMGMKKASQTALAGLQLQKLLPNARVIYSSATGATEVNNLVYAQRLGLWGDGTAFATADDFITAVESSGVAGMEIIAKDLKSMGLYSAKTLSFEGVEYDTVTHNLTPPQKALYDKIAKSWQVVLQNINKAIEENNSSSHAKTAAMSKFWGAHQRFFSQIILTLQMPTVIDDIYKQLAADKSIVLQLVNTNEAGTNRALAEARANSEDGEIDYDELDLSPKISLIDYLQRSFPVDLYQETIDENGNTIKIPVLDSDGNKVQNPKAVQMRDDLIEQLDRELVLPESPLDIILNTFGHEQVAEITGRSIRVIEKDTEDNKREKQEERRTKAHVESDKNKFMDGEKRILVFSDAGGTGSSFHSDLSRKNQQQRVHYVLQPGWRADNAVQGFGRSHRSNQRITPIFKLVTTDLKAQKRFLSSIARRLDQLGALTKGQRQTGGQGVLDGSYNLEGAYARQALYEFYKAVDMGYISGITTDMIKEEMAIDIFTKDEYGQKAYNKDIMMDSKRFMNRIMSTTVDFMDKIFDNYMSILNQNIQDAITAGTYDSGIQVTEAEKTNVVDEKVIYEDSKTGGKSYLTTIELEIKNDKSSWDQINADVVRYKDNFKGFYTEERSGKIYAIVKQRHIDAAGNESWKVKRKSVIADQFIDEYEFRSKYNKVSDLKEAESLWNKDFEEYPATRKKVDHIVKGLILPIWHRLPERINVRRYIDEDGNAHLGRYFIKREVDEIIKAFDVAMGAEYTPDELHNAVSANGIVSLANGFEFEKKKYQGLSVAKVIGANSYRDKDRLTRAGAMFKLESALSYKGEFYIPMDNFSEVLEKIITLFDAPVVSVVDSDGGYIQAKSAKNSNNNRNFEVNEETTPYTKESFEERPKNSEESGLRFASEPAMGDLPGQLNIWEENDYTPGNSNTIEDVTFVERVSAIMKGITFQGEPITGTPKIKTSQDVAFLFKNLERASTENAFAVFVKDNGEYQVLWISHGATNATVIDAKLVYAGAKEFGAKQVYFVHNHPSGNLKSSEADRQIHSKLRQMLDLADIEMMPGIIINLDSGKYGEFDSYDFANQDANYDVKNASDVDIYSFDNQKLYKPSSELTKITQSRDVAQFLSKMKRGTTPKLGALILDRANHITKALFYDETIEKNKLAEELMYEAGKHGESVILHSNTDFRVDYLRWIKNKLGIGGVTLLDFIKSYPDKEITIKYDSHADNGLLEPKVKYESLDDLINRKANERNNDVRYKKESPTGFYSTVERALERINQKKGTPEQFKAMLLKNGAKQAELDWMGYDDAFTGQKSVTKEDIQNFIDQNNIDVQEVVKGTSKWEDDELIDNGDVVANLVENEDGTWSFQSDLSEGEEKYDTREIAMREAEFATVSDVYSQSGTKYEQYVLPGGENYRELLLTMPFKNNKKTFEEWKEHREFLGIPNEENTKEKYEEEVGWYDKRGVYAKEEVFKSSHFDEPNILAHIRFDERTDANGERVLMVQEIQSDWAQKGKKEGFNTPELKSKRNDLHKEWSEVEKEMIPLQRKSRLEVVGGTDPLTPEERNRLNYLEKRDKELATQNQELGFNPVPDMPFKQTPQWVNLALRRAIRYASENGFDRIAWTTGEQQAERYDLSKQVDYITKHSENRVNKEKNQIDVTISVNNGLIGLEVDKETGKVVDQNGSTKLDQVVGKGLDEVIGKDVAEKILSLDETEHTLKDKDLKVGGEGMKSFYNQIVPNLAGKLGKKFGAQVEAIELDNKINRIKKEKTFDNLRDALEYEKSLLSDQYKIKETLIDNADGTHTVEWEEMGPSTQLSLPITQSMRESAMEGMPLFEKKPEYTGDLNDFAEKTAKWVEGARKQIKEFSDKFGVDAVGVSNVSQLPADVRQKLGGSMQGVGGFIDVNTGKIYVNLTKVSSYDKVQRILIHEAIGHKGVRGLLGTELDDVLWSVYRGMPEGAFNELVQAYETEDPYLIAEEYIAKISEDGSNPTLLNRVISKIREILRKIFPKLSYSNSEIRTLLEKSKDYLLSQKYSNKKDEGVRFNKYSELTRVNETVASTGSVYETYRKGGVYLKVRYSDHDSNILMADSDLELNIELRGTNEAKSLIESAIDAKSKNIINLDRDNENINVLGYDSVEKRGGYVILKYTQTEEYTDEQLKERFSDNKNNIDQYKNSKYTRKEGDKWIKETPKTITLLDREFYRRFPNVRFSKSNWNELHQNIVNSYDHLQTIAKAIDAINESNIGNYRVFFDNNFSEITEDEVDNGEQYMYSDEDLSKIIKLQKEAYKNMVISLENAGYDVTTPYDNSIYATKDGKNAISIRDHEVKQSTLNHWDSVISYNVLKDNMTLSGLSKQVLPDIRFSKVKQATKDAEILNGWKDKVRRNMQDKMLGVRRLQEWLTAQGVEITDDQDAYNAENKSASKAFAAQKKYEKEQYKDLVNAVQQIKNSTDKTTEEISTYLMAKHAPERNEYFINKAVDESEPVKELQATISKTRRDMNKASKDGDLDGTMEFANELNLLEDQMIDLKNAIKDEVLAEFETASGFTTDKANKIKEKFESEVDKYYVDNLIKAVKDNTDFVLDRWQQDGFISNETKQMLKDRWKNYVPLRGWQYDEGDPEFEYFMDTYTGKLNSPNKTAKGRKSIADDPLSNLVNMVHSAIIMGEKNKVKQKMANLISANIETLGDKAGYNQYFRVQLNDNPDNPEFMYLSPAEVKAMDTETIKRLNPEQVIAIEHGNKRSIGQMKEHEANVFIDGKMYTMHFQDPEIARAMNNAHFPRMQAATLFLQNSIGKVTRTMSSLLTSHNPAFFIPNLFRDVAFAGEGFFIEQGPKATIMFGKNVARVQKAIIKGYLGREEKTDLDKLYNQFIQYGGQTGYAHLHDVQQFKNKIKSDIKKIDNAGKLRNAPVKVFNNMLDLIESVSGWSEDVSRFATFVTLIEMGESPEVATNHAKNITVNFNRKGVYSGMFGSIYAFFNARVQGGARLAHLGKVHPARSVTIAVGHIAIGFLMSQLFDMLSGDDDEGIREYDKVSDYMKSNYLNLPDFIRGEGYISIPVPHGTRMFHSLGSLLYDYSTGRKNMMQVASGGFGNAIGEFSPVDFHRFINQKGELSLMPLAPTSLVPAFETFWTNTDFMGRPIAKEMYTKQLDEQTPDSQKYYKSVNPILKSFTRFLFTVGGGDPESGLVYKPGTTEKVPDALDINPEHLEHLIQGYTGGLGKFTNDLFKSLVVPAVTYAQEEQHKGDVFDSYVNTWKDHGEVIPIFNRFFRDFYGDPVRDAFYNIYEQANIIDTWKKHYKDTGDIEGLMNLMKDPERFYNSKRAILYHDAINNLRGIGNLENLPEADKERIDNEVRKLMIEAVGDYKEVTYKGKQ